MSRTRMMLAILIAVMLGAFIIRSVIPAFAFGKNDFSDPFCASWLWRHGENPYDIALASQVNKELAHSDVTIVPIYPMTTYVLTSPLSMFPWKWANLIWALLNFAAVLVSSLLLLRIAGFRLEQNVAWQLIAVVCSFAPFHTGAHVGNVAPIATALCFGAIYLASRRQDLAAGAVLAMAACLKPQLGVWILV